MKTEPILRAHAEILHESIEWWKKEMAGWVDLSDQWEKKTDHPEHEEKMLEISNAMNYLIAKGNIENKLLEELEEDITQLTIKQAFDDHHKSPLQKVKQKKKRKKE